MAPLDRAFNWMIAIGIVIMAGWESFEFWQAHYLPPVAYRAVEALTPDVVAGQPFAFRIMFDRRDNCPGHADRTIIADHNRDTVVATQVVPLTPGEIGESKSIAGEMPTPPTLAPGPYALRIIATFQCSRGTYVFVLPETNFRIVAGTP